MFFELRDDSKYKKIYFDDLKCRLAESSIILECDSEEHYQNQLDAINIAFEGVIDRTQRWKFFQNLCNLVQKVTAEAYNDFRTSDAIVNGSSTILTEPRMIRNDLMYLMDDYLYYIDNCETEDDYFRAEAIFHIRLLRIHPFGDGNGRVARTILAYHLCSHHLAPVIIPIERKSEYCKYIENSDVEGMVALFKELSNNELEHMIELYAKLDFQGLIAENGMTPEQEERYKALMNQ